MKKVTVKHYLNTNISIQELAPNGKYLNDIIYHPIYVQITFARKTTQIRSYTGIFLTSEDYTYYKNGIYEKMADAEKVKYLICEPKRIQSAIEYLLNKRENDVDRTDFLSGGIINKFDDIRGDVEELMQPMEVKLIEFGWSYLNMISNRCLKEKTMDIHNVFRIDMNLVTILNIIKQKTNYDLALFFEKGELNFWNNINLLIEKYEKEEYSFIDFIENYDSLINSVEGIKDKRKFIGEIEGLIEYNT